MINIASKKLFLSTLLLLSGFACRKETNQNFPSVPVNLNININNPEYIDLQNVGGWVYVTGGIQGIILYRKDEDNINAFDRISTYQIEKSCRVFVDSSNIVAVDTCSNSKFLLFDGYPISGPAGQPLIQYHSSLTGSMLTVTN